MKKRISLVFLFLAIAFLSVCCKIEPDEDTPAQTPTEVLDTTGDNTSAKCLKLKLSGAPENNKVYGYLSYSIPTDETKVFYSMSAKVKIPENSYNKGLTGTKAYWKSNGTIYEGSWTSVSSDTWSLVTIPSSKTSKVNSNASECGLIFQITTSASVSYISVYVDDIKINYKDSTNKQFDFENGITSDFKFISGSANSTGVISIASTTEVIEDGGTEEATFTSSTDSTTANTADVLGITATTVSSSDTNVATVEIADGKIAITSVAKGSTTVTCEDASSHRATIAVTVSENGAITLGTITKYTSTSANYSVQYYKMEISGSYSETASETSQQTGAIGAIATYTEKTYEGFALDSTKTGTAPTIASDGSTVYKIYYARNTITITLEDKYWL